MIEDNLNNLSQGIDDEKATDLEDITRHAPQWQQRACQQLTSPHYHIVSQALQQHYHLMRFKAFFVALGEAQSLLVALERRFDPCAVLIVEGDVGQQHGQRIQEVGEHLSEQYQHVACQQGREQHTNCQLSILLATAHRKTHHRTFIGARNFPHSAQLSLGNVWIIDPLVGIVARV